MKNKAVGFACHSFCLFKSEAKDTKNDCLFLRSIFGQVL